MCFFLSFFVFLITIFKAKKYYFKIDSPVLCKRSITYQDVRLLDGDGPYDTFIHFQITKTHLLLYIRSFTAYSMQHYSVSSSTHYIITYIYANKHFTHSFT